MYNPSFKLSGTLLIVFTFCLFFPLDTFAKSQNKIIEDIRIVGLKRLSKGDFLKILPFKKKDTYNENLVNKSVSRLYNADVFKNVSVGEQDTPSNNKIIVYNIQERPWVKKIDIRNNSIVDNSTIKKKITNSEQDFFDPYVLKGDLKALYDLYTSEGFIGTKIKFSEEFSKKHPNEMTLVITVFEGTKLNIDRVKILGNNLLSSTYLKSHFRSLKEPYIFGLLKSPLIPEMISYDSEQMKLLAFNKGFVDFKILGIRVIASISYKNILKKMSQELRSFHFSNSRARFYLTNITESLNKQNKRASLNWVSKLRSEGFSHIKKSSKKQKWKLYSDNLTFQIKSLFSFTALLEKKLPFNSPLELHLTQNKSSYDILFYVNEGKQYLFDGVTIIGSKRINKPFLKKKFLKIKQGEVFEQNTFDIFKNKVAEYYRDKGYFGVVVKDTAKKNPKNPSIHHTLLIQEGEKMHVEQMFIKGNTKTKDFVIDRELRIKEGSIFNQSQIQLSQRLLQRLGYFKNINILPSAGSDENLVNLTWDVEEDQTGSFQFGGGYGTETGFSLYGNFTESNLAGLGLGFNTRVQYGEYQKSIQTGLSSSYIGHIPIGWNFSLGYSWIKEEAAPRYDRDHNGKWDKIINKDGTYYFSEEGDDDFYDYYDENRTGTFDPSGTPSGSPVDFTPSEEDDLYSDHRYFERHMVFLQLGTGYSFSDFWSIGVSNGLTLSKYDNPHNIDINNLYEDDYYTLKSDLLRDKFSYSSDISISLRYNSTNDPLSPTLGINTFGSVDLYGVEGGYDQFLKVQGMLNTYVPILALTKKDFYIVWASGLNIESIRPLFNDKVKLHYENQLSFNTMTEVRGWSDFIYNAELLGLGKISLGTELRFSVPQTNKLIWLIGFFDAGNMSLEPSSLPLDFKSYLYSTGFGLRVDLQSFPLRFYLAQKLKWKNGHMQTIGGLTFQFAISSAF